MHCCGHRAGSLCCRAALPPEPQKVVAHVVRFPDFTAYPENASFAAVPLEHQTASAAFNQYRREISELLVVQGLVSANDEAEADFLVTLDYGLRFRDETELVEEYGVIVSSQWATFTETHYNNYAGLYEPYETTEYIPSVTDVKGYHTETNTWYDRYLVLRMFDRVRSTPETLYPAYEGTVTSSGSTPSFVGVSTCLFRMLFRNFMRQGTEDTSILSETCMR
ncbi:MAG: hypothetical protein CMM46_06380 [Rhodospirillaceae bacterium]|nr:hypothetical protein [Rhodospirillaceae bacterium]